MKIISVINYKGGVGKTTLTANVAAELALRGKRILLIDMDPQSSLTFSFVTPEHWSQNLQKDRTIRDWYSKSHPASLKELIHTPDRMAAVIKTGGCLDLIPSHLDLINVDLELATELGGATLAQAKQRYVAVHRRLAAGLSQIPKGQYDYVLIDCPPNFNVVTKTALVASQHILVPAKPDYLSTLGIEYLRRSIEQLIGDFNEYAAIAEGESVEKIAPALLGVVFSMIQEYGQVPISATRPFMAQTAKLGVPVFSEYVKENKTLFADAPQYGVPVVVSARTNPSHQAVVQGLERVASEFLAKLGDK